MEQCSIYTQNNKNYLKLFIFNNLKINILYYKNKLFTINYIKNKLGEHKDYEVLEAKLISKPLKINTIKTSPS